MSRSLSSVKVVASMISKQVSCATSVRGFAVGVEGSRMNAVAAQKARLKEPATWVPDSAGVYRPENSSNEIDVAELRAMLLKQSKNKKN